MSTQRKVAVITGATGETLHADGGAHAGHW
jgi:hypothetical protein